MGHHVCRSFSSRAPYSVLRYALQITGKNDRGAGAPRDRPVLELGPSWPYLGAWSTALDDCGRSAPAGSSWCNARRVLLAGES